MVSANQGHMLKSQPHCIVRAPKVWPAILVNCQQVRESGLVFPPQHVYSRLWPGEDDSFPGGQWPTGQVSKVDTTDVAKHRLSVDTPPPDMWRPCCPQDWAGLELGQMNDVSNRWTGHLNDVHKAVDNVGPMADF